MASLISTPAAYQIAQMKPGQERDNAIQDAASNAILTGILGGIGARDTLPQKPNAENAGAPLNVVPAENVSVMSPSQAPVSEKIDDLAAAVKNLQDMLRGKLPAQAQQTVNMPTDRADEIIRNVFPVERHPVVDAASNNYPDSDGLIPKQPESDVLQTAAKRTELAREIGIAKNAEALTTSPAKAGQPANNDYRATFFAANPRLKGHVVVHHAVEQQVLTRHPEAFTKSEIHSIENLRGIPKKINPDLHLSKIRRAWNQFYKANPTATREQLLQQAAKIDAKYGSRFIPRAP